MADRELSLGTIFTGHVDARFRRAVTQMNTALRGLATAQGRVNKKTKESAVVTRRARKNTKALRNEFSAVGKQLSRVHGGFERLTAAMKVTASYGLASAAIFGVINALRVGTKEIFEFHQALKNLQAITGASNVEIAVLADVIKDVASKTKYSGKEAADAAILLGQAGFTAGESVDALQAVAYLATGTLTDMSVSADLVTTAIRAFGLEASESMKVADIFASAVNKSKLTIDKLRIAFNYLAPVANKAGIKLEEAAAGTMLLANAGLRGSTIGTGFRQVISRLIAPTNKLRAAFIASGADLSKLNPIMSSMSTVIGELTRVVPTATEAFRLFGLRGAPAVAVFSEQGVEGFEAMLKKVYEVGTSFNMAEKQMEGLAVMAKNLADKFKVLAIAIGEGGLAGAFNVLLVVGRKVADLLIFLTDNVIGNAVVGIIGMTGAILVLRQAFRYLGVIMASMAYGTTIHVVRQATKFYGALSVAIEATRVGFVRLARSMFATPLGAIVFGVSAVIVAFVTWQRHQKKIIENLQKNIIEEDKHIKKLKDYKKQLGEMQEGSMEYRAVIKRLTNDYPELRKHIDRVTWAFKDQGKAMDELTEKHRRLRIEASIKLLEEQTKKVEKLEQAIKSLEKMRRPADTERSTLYPSSVKKMLEKGAEDLDTAQENVKDQIAGLSELMRDYVSEGMRLGTLTNLIVKNWNLQRDTARNLAVELLRFYKAERENRLKTLDVYARLKDGWIEAYNVAKDTEKKRIVLLEERYRAENTAIAKTAKNESEARVLSLALITEYEKKIKDITGEKVSLAEKTTETLLINLDISLKRMKERHEKHFSDLDKEYAHDLLGFIVSEGGKNKATAEHQQKRRTLEIKFAKESISFEETRLAILQNINKEDITQAEAHYAYLIEKLKDHHKSIVDLEKEAMEHEVSMIETHSGLTAQRLVEEGEIRDKHYNNILRKTQIYYNKMMVLLNKEYEAKKTIIRLEETDKEKQNIKIKKLDEKYTKDKIKIYQQSYKISKAYVNALLSEEKRLATEREELNDKRRGILKNWGNYVREVALKILTGERKIAAQRMQAENLTAKVIRDINAGNLKDVEENIETAKGIYKGFVDELVTAYQGKKIDRGLFQRTLKTLMDRIRVLVDLETKATDMQSRQVANRMDVVKNKIDSVNAAMKFVKASMDELAKTKFKIEGIDTTITKFKDIISNITNLKKLLEELIRKPYFIDVKTRIDDIRKGLEGTKSPSAGFQSGTGPVGLPYTGMFYGHQGEIVKSPSESAMERAGAKISNILHTINLNINGTSHTLYGDEEAVGGLVRTLRREQLTTP